jgi:hypothetical protein
MDTTVGIPPLPQLLDEDDELGLFGRHLSTLTGKGSRLMIKNVRAILLL